jgi:phosphoenolpyruvate carboxylase
MQTVNQVLNAAERVAAFDFSRVTPYPLFEALEELRTADRGMEQYRESS